MLVKSSEILVAVTVDSSDLKEFSSSLFLDSTGFPWKTHKVVDGILYIRPMRDGKLVVPGQLFDYDHRLPHVHMERVVDALSTVECNDMRVDSFVCNVFDKIDSWNHGRIEEIRSESYPQETVFIQSIGVYWGPFSISPMDAPAEILLRGEVRGDKRRAVIDRISGERFSVSVFANTSTTDLVKIYETEHMDMYKAINFAKSVVEHGLESALVADTRSYAHAT